MQIHPPASNASKCQTNKIHLIVFLKLESRRHWKENTQTGNTFLRIHRWPSSRTQEPTLSVPYHIPIPIRIVIPKHISKTLLVIAAAVGDEVEACSTRGSGSLRVAGAVGGVGALDFFGTRQYGMEKEREESGRTAASVAGLVV